jgi:hypothetical protein
MGQNYQQHNATAVRGGVCIHEESESPTWKVFERLHPHFVRLLEGKKSIILVTPRKGEATNTIKHKEKTMGGINGTYCSICYRFILTELRAYLRKAYSPRVEVSEI